MFSTRVFNVHLVFLRLLLQSLDFISTIFVILPRCSLAEKDTFLAPLQKIKLLHTKLSINSVRLKRRKSWVPRSSIPCLKRILGTKSHSQSLSNQWVHRMVGLKTLTSSDLHQAPCRRKILLQPHLKVINTQKITTRLRICFWNLQFSNNYLMISFQCKHLTTPPISLPKTTSLSTKRKMSATWKRRTVKMAEVDGVLELAVVRVTGRITRTPQIRFTREIPAAPLHIQGKIPGN